MRRGGKLDSALCHSISFTIQSTENMGMGLKLTWLPEAECPHALAKFNYKMSHDKFN